MMILAVLIADVLYIQEGMAAKLVNIDIEDRLKKIAGRVPTDRLLKMAEFLRFIESSLKSHVNRQMLTDVLVVTANQTTAAWLA